jgi:O-antigen/teichoic acid export membrane protein
MTAVGQMKSASLRSLFLKNAFANVVGGVGSALFNLVLPALVVRHLSGVEFSVWSLALQVLIYLQLFGFGLQTAMTRFIAHGHELGDLADQRKTLKAGLALGAGFVALATLAVALLVLCYPLLFSKVPAGMVGDFRICVAVLGLSAAFQLFALIPIGLFAGLHRNIVPVGGQLLVRMLSLLALWLALRAGAGLLALSLTLAACGALLVPVTFLSIRRWVGALWRGLGPLDRPRLRELMHYCGGLAVWNIAMLLVNGIATMLVGYFQFDKVGPYSLAVTVIAIMVGVQQAIMAPLLATGATLNARQETRAALAGLLIKATRICALGLLASLLVIKFFGASLLAAWLGAAYTGDVFSLLVILAAANLIRNTALPYALLLLALNKQKQVQHTVVLEGVVNLVASLWLAREHGALGVAYGALIGALAGCASNYVFNFSGTPQLVPNIFRYSVHALVLPVLAAALLVMLF